MKKIKTFLGYAMTLPVGTLILAILSCPLGIALFNVWIRFDRDERYYSFLSESIDQSIKTYQCLNGKQERLLATMVLIVSLHLYFKWYYVIYYVTMYLYLNHFPSWWVWIPFAISCLVLILDVIDTLDNVLIPLKKRLKKASPKEPHEPATCQD